MRRLTVPVLTFIGLALLAQPVLASGTIHLVYAETEITTDVPPALIDGRVLVPIRVISENLGFVVDWRQDLQAVIVSRAGTSYPVPALAPGSVHLVINGVEGHPDVPPRIINGRVMVPIRFVSEAFGLQVDWRQDAQMVAIGPLKPMLEMHFIDVGQGDAIFIKLPNGQKMLVDGGSNAAAPTVLAYLAAQKVTSLDYVVATHPDADDVGGLDEVIRALPVGTVVMPWTGDDDAYKDLNAAMKDKNLKPLCVYSGWQLIADHETEVDVMGPAAPHYNNANDCSVVLKVSNSSSQFMLMADAETEGVAGMLTAGLDLNADVIQVGNHGGSTSTTSELLQAVNPTYAVICVGAGNTAGDPSQKALDALAAAGVTVYRTDLVGTIVAYATQNSIWFETAKTPR